MLAITFANAGTMRVQLSDMDIALIRPCRKMRSPLMKLSGNEYVGSFTTLSEPYCESIFVCILRSHLLIKRSPSRGDCQRIQRRRRTAAAAGERPASKTQTRPAKDCPCISRESGRIITSTSNKSHLPSREYECCWLNVDS